MMDGQLFRRSRQDRTGMDRWLMANTVFGAIVAIGLVAMAVIGSAQAPVTQVATSSGAALGSTPTRVQTGGSPPPSALRR
jgi:hypothetical protein